MNRNAVTRTCERCSAPFESVALQARFCSGKCRQLAFKARRSAAKRAEARRVTAAEAVRVELEAAGRLDTYLGAAALALAERVDTSTAVMGFAALVKELRTTMEAATAGVKVVLDPVDELRERRDRKYAG